MAAPFSHLCVTFDLEGVNRVAKYDNHPEDDFLQDGAVCGGVRDRTRPAINKSEVPKIFC